MTRASSDDSDHDTSGLDATAVEGPLPGPDHWTIRASLVGLPADFQVVETIRSSGDEGSAPLPLRLPVVTLAERGGDDDADFAIFEDIGEGGEGVVQRAEQRSLRREVAVKRTRTVMRSESRFAKLLLEGRRSGALEHPNIVPVHLLARTPDGEPLLVMKRVAGTDWRTLIRHPDDGHWRHLEGDQLSQHLTILMGVCQAVEYAHRRGVIHLDIKPANVMVGELGEIYLMDWGLALDADGGAVDLPGTGALGTPAYMAPEMVPRKGAVRVSQQTDVFLLGACLCEVLTGRPPWNAEDVFEAVIRASEALLPPFPDSAPTALQEICRRACAREPSERFGSAAELRRALSEFLQHRASLQLAEASTARLSELENTVAGLAPDDEDGRRRVQQLAGGCRFGCEQALREWPENTRARRSLQRCLELVIELDLARRDHVAAAANLAALPDPSPELAARVKALQDAIVAEGDARAQLVALQREQRVRSDDWWRSGLAALNGVGWALALTGAWLALEHGVFPATAQANLAFGVFAVLQFLVVLVLGRRFMLDNRVRVQITAATLAYTCTFLLTRVVAAVVDMPLRDAILMDYVTMFLFIAVIAAFVERVLAWGAIVTALAATLAAFVPEYAILIGAALILVLNLALAWVLRPASSLRILGALGSAGPT